MSTAHTAHPSPSSSGRPHVVTGPVSGQGGGGPFGPSGARLGRSRRRTPRWRAVVLGTALLLPVVEIAMLVAAGHAIGVWWTLALLLVMSLVGTWLMKREGTSSWRALQDAVRTGRMPTSEAADAALILAGGALLVLPGFLSDVAGLLLILPVTRPVARRALQRSVERRVIAATRIVPSVRVDRPDASTSRTIPHVDLRPGH